MSKSAATDAVIYAVATAPDAKARKAATLQARALAQFSVAQWTLDVEHAASDLMTASQRMLELILSARGMVDEAKVREVVRDSFAAAYVALNPGVPHDEAVKAKSVKNRVADAMAVFKCATLPKSMPGNLQHAAAACREAGKLLTASNEPKAPKGPSASAKKAPAGEITNALENENDDTDEDPAIVALSGIRAALNVLRGQTGSDEVLSIIASLADTVGELEEAFRVD